MATEPGGGRVTTKKDILDWLAAWDDDQHVLVFDQAGNQLDIEELNDRIAMEPVIVVNKDA